ncbi:bifunctional DNA primase/polymerase [Actinopolymorpha sp. B17G11]|uniref:bifunctional DNA primase/polymerase n=1 Tax=Actinopolymorpha sp. B17G11 TaxID=3160861 RepID=UPI0032E38860
MSHPTHGAPHASAACQAALGAAGRAWHVIPLRPNSKIPAFPNHPADACDRTDPWCCAGHVDWETRATTDPDRIRRGWARIPYGVGIACGPSHLVVIDLDTPKPDDRRPPQWQIPGVVDGHDVFATVCEQAGQPIPLDTYTVATPTGGTHLYYRHPDHGPTLRNTTGGRPGSLGWKIDTRAGGGQVVAAGTTINGRTYRVVRDVDPAPLPGWLAERLTPRPLPPERPARVNLATDRRGRYLHKAVTEQVGIVRNAAEGGRNHTLYMSAQVLGQLVAGGSLTAEDVTALLTQAALDTGLTAHETARTIASGLRAGTRRPRSVAA